MADTEIAIVLTFLILITTTILITMLYVIISVFQKKKAKLREV